MFDLDFLRTDLVAAASGYNVVTAFNVLEQNNETAVLLDYDRINDLNL